VRNVVNGKAHVEKCGSLNIETTFTNPLNHTQTYLC